MANGNGNGNGNRNGGKVNGRVDILNPPDIAQLFSMYDKIQYFWSFNN